MIHNKRHYIYKLEVRRDSCRGEDKVTSRLSGTIKYNEEQIALIKEHIKFIEREQEEEAKWTQPKEMLS